MSPWGLWIGAIPSAFDSAILFSDAEISLFAGHDVHGRLTQVRKLLSSSWSEYIQAIVDPSISFDRFVAAYAFVSGFRTLLQFSKEDASSTTISLLPIINSARHSNVPNTAVENRMLQDVPVDRVFDVGVAEFVLVAKTKIPKNSEITIHYGFADNYESLLAQGVVQDFEELDSLTFIVAQSSDPDVTSGLQRLGIDRLEFRVTPISVPIALFQYLRITNGVNVDDTQAFELLQRGSSVSVDNDLKAFSELMLVTRRLQAQWSSTVEDDLKLLRSGSLTSRQHIAIHYRVREKLVVVGVERIVKEMWSLWILPASSAPQAHVPTTE